MILKITDGVTTVILNDSSGTPTEHFVGARYFPRDPGNAATVTETADVSYYGTNSVLKTQVNRIEALLKQAEYDFLPTVYMEYHHQITGYAVRSQLVGGRVTWSEERAMREIYQDNAFGEISVIFERVNYWEEPEETLGTNTIRNGNSLPYNEIGLNPLLGTLPAPLKVTIENSSGANLNTHKFYLNCDQIETDGSEHMLGGGSTTWAGAITHNTRLFTLPVPATFLDKTRGQEMHVIAGFSSLVGSGLYLKASVYTSIGGIHILSYAGNEKEVGAKTLLNLGTLPLPPGGIANTDISIGITGYSTAAGSATLEFVQLAPARNAVELTQTGYQLTAGDKIIEDGAEGQSYYASGSNRYNIVNRSGGPLLAYPGVNNRIYLLFDEGSSFNSSRQVGLTITYRPRWSTI